MYDFDRAEGDKIEFQVADAASFEDDLKIEFDVFFSHTVITTVASETDSVTLVGYNHLTNPLMASDFVFV